MILLASGGGTPSKKIPYFAAMAASRAVSGLMKVKFVAIRMGDSGFVRSDDGGTALGGHRGGNLTQTRQSATR